MRVVAQGGDRLFNRSVHAIFTHLYACSHWTVISTPPHPASAVSVKLCDRKTMKHHYIVTEYECAVSRVHKAMPCHRTGYDRHGIHILLHWTEQNRQQKSRDLYGYPSVHGAFFSNRKSYGLVRCGLEKIGNLTVRFGKNRKSYGAVRCRFHLL